MQIVNQMFQTLLSQRVHPYGLGKRFAEYCLLHCVTGQMTFSAYLCPPQASSGAWSIVLYVTIEP